MKPFLSRSIWAGSSLIFASLTLASALPASAAEVNVYTTREPGLIQPLFDAFTAETGTKVNVLFGKDELIERIAAEGANSPADVLVTVDVGTLNRAKEAGITQPIVSAVVDANIPAQYRDADGAWIGLSQRARVIYASRDRVPQDTITYAELADPQWRGRICTRSGQHPYNIGLIASRIAHEGAEKTKEWLANVRDNLAHKPTGNDRAQAKGIFAGECDIALGNTYYMGLMQTNEQEPEQKDWAKAIKILFPDAEGDGTHVNISGVVLARNAPNKDEAIKLIEFLTSDEAQELYAEVNFEYPLKPGVPPSDIVASWGELKADTLPLTDVAKNRAEASALVDEVNFDAGPNS
ncbi:Fe(3+) ABC transporter substrate-binding protein [Microbaculum sp. FT89]|uniref:Fe(3+) ABC transporter substrate-binding protein n=1 Tax=Microbaculum sp. FT89 TaxID=3447298 RepID=UPI003F53027F